MLNKIKKRFYFVVAGYFAFWARFVLRRWRPRIIVITGSTGKTSLLHLVEAQIGDKAVYSHHANGAIGLPFHILGFSNPNVTARWKWPGRFISAPIRALRRVPKQRLYVAEADCDRPHEGAFTARFLRPEVTMWVSVFRTHSGNFDRLVPRQFASHEEAIAYEFGHFAEATTHLVIANGDQPDLMKQLSRVGDDVDVRHVSQKDITSHELSGNKTTYTIFGKKVSLVGLHPKELGSSLQMVSYLLGYLGMPLDPNYKQLVMPPGRSSVFEGKRGTTLIDSTYNTGLGATKAILELFGKYPSKHKWAVVGDILEQGSLEAQEHARLADLVVRLKAERIILLGPRTKKYTYPLLKKRMPDVIIISFNEPKEVLDYLQQNLKGGEVVLFRGVRYLEGVVEQLLAHANDANNLVRRGKKQTKQRQKWGLPR